MGLGLRYSKEVLIMTQYPFWSPGPVTVTLRFISKELMRQLIQLGGEESLRRAGEEISEADGAGLGWGPQS